MINDFLLVIWWPAVSLMFLAHIVPLVYGRAQEASHLPCLGSRFGPSKAVGSSPVIHERLDCSTALQCDVYVRFFFVTC